MIVSFSTSRTTHNINLRNFGSAKSSVVVITNNKNNNNTKRVDWRDWFRSSDYDDPWSPYHSFQQQQPKDEETAAIHATKIIASHCETYQKTIVPSVLLAEGGDQAAIIAPWQRRRHGMNLEPLTLQLHHETIIPAAASGRHELDNNNNNNTITNEDDPLLQNGGAKKGTATKPIEASLLEKAQTKIRRIDTQTRFLCRMLDDLYRTGIWRESDRPTVERCHRVRIFFVAWYNCVFHADPIPSKSCFHL